MKRTQNEKDTQSEQKKKIKTALQATQTQRKQLESSSIEIPTIHLRKLKSNSRSKNIGEWRAEKRRKKNSTTSKSTTIKFYLNKWPLLGSRNRQEKP